MIFKLTVFIFPLFILLFYLGEVTPQHPYVLRLKDIAQQHKMMWCLFFKHPHIVLQINAIILLNCF